MNCPLMPFALTKCVKGNLTPCLLSLRGKGERPSPCGRGVGEGVIPESPLFAGDLTPCLLSLRGKGELPSPCGRGVGGEVSLTLFCLFILLVLLLCAGAWAQQTNRVRVSTTWRAAEVEGRTLWVSEQSVALRIDSRTELQVGWQKVVAKGRVRTNRFSTSARWFGAEYLLRDEGNRQLALSLRRLEGEEGVADVAEGLFTYVAPRVDTVSLLSTRYARGWTTGYRLSYSRTHAGTESADTVGLSVSAVSTRATRWQVQLDGGIYADRHRDTTYRPVLSGAISFPLGHGLRAQFGATFAPSGFPVAGTPIEGLTAFVLYRPGSLVESWRDRPAGYLSLQLGMER